MRIFGEHFKETISVKCSQTGQWDERYGRVMPMDRWPMVGLEIGKKAETRKGKLNGKMFDALQQSAGASFFLSDQSSTIERQFD